MRKILSETKTYVTIAPKLYLIIGAGMSGASAASELIKQGIPQNEILILEKNEHLGGMMRTKDGIDWGAHVIMANYPSVNTVAQNQLTLTKFLPIDKKVVNGILYDGNEEPSYWDQFCYGARLCYESILFAKEVWSYHNACQNLAPTPPMYQDKSFSEFATQNNFYAIPKFLKLWVPLMGYGSFNTIPAFRVLSYMSKDSVPGLSVYNALFSPFYVGIKGGYQQIVENMLKDFEVITSVEIESIARFKTHVEIEFKDNEGAYSIKAQNLILATPPKFWSDLNMKLTNTEQACIEQSTYYRYPVAICDIENFPDHQVIVPEALEESGFGHIALICAQEKIENGWRCSIYMNVKPGDNDFSLDIGEEGREVLMTDLEHLGFTRDQVKIIDTKIWNYNTCIPWGIGMDLEREQGVLRTLHVNGAKPSSFETVKRTEESARETIRRHLGKKADSFQYLKTICTFFQLPKEETPVEMLNYSKNNRQ